MVNRDPVSFSAIKLYQKFQEGVSNTNQQIKQVNDAWKLGFDYEHI